MPDSSEKSLSMAASADTIMDAIADVAAYPEWTPAVKQVTVTDPGDGARPRRVEFVMDAGMIKDTYELEYDWAADGRSVSWTLVRGKLQKAQNGSYTLQDNGTDTLVTYRLTVQLSIPLIGPLKRNAERVIMDTALKELRKRVETPGRA
ncbi:SRPBCC family protein [Nakamurella aerolata]|uniref:SRPBCC family protein n=1 Tax=Nakamurella aerolata TaxID=1656892 RepID=A0A849A269_9ACTN|nr:SRPBCC family protein [Nakamurella aerolata]NNG34655.1 SRPBCC family protein [Nakamurella aerolata]